MTAHRSTHYIYLRVTVNHTELQTEHSTFMENEILTITDHLKFKHLKNNRLS